MIHDKPLLLVTVLLSTQPSARAKPKAPQDRTSSTSVHSKGNAASRPAAARDLWASRYEVSRDLAYSIAPSRHPMEPASWYKGTARGTRNLCSFGGEGNLFERARQIRCKILMFQ